MYNHAGICIIKMPDLLVLSTEIYYGSVFVVHHTFITDTTIHEFFSSVGDFQLQKITASKRMKMKRRNKVSERERTKLKCSTQFLLCQLQLPRVGYTALYYTSQIRDEINVYTEAGNLTSLSVPIELHQRRSRKRS